MAQFVGYFTNHVTYEEGPFVVCDGVGFSNGIRVEVELKDCRCPVVPDVTIVDYLSSHGFTMACYANSDFNRKKLIKIVDHLNKEVVKGNIVLQGNTWVYKTFPKNS